LDAFNPAGACPWDVDGTDAVRESLRGEFHADLLADLTGKGMSLAGATSGRQAQRPAGLWIGAALRMYGQTGQRSKDHAFDGAHRRLMRPQVGRSLRCHQLIKGHVTRVNRVCAKKPRLDASFTC